MTTFCECLALVVLMPPLTWFLIALYSKWI